MEPVRLRTYQFLALSLTACLLLGRISRADTSKFPVRFPGGARFTLLAPKIRYYPETGFVCTEGTCELIFPDIRIFAEQIHLDIDKRKLFLRDVRIAGNENFSIVGSYAAFDMDSKTFNLAKPQLTIPHSKHLSTTIAGHFAECRDGTCNVENVVATICPHSPPGYELRAEAAIFHPSGDIDLENSILVVENHRLAKLHWIRLRPPSKTGFLPPKIAWDKDGGLVLGPRGYIPITENTYATGHVAVRTKQGFESVSRIHTPKLDLALEQLFDNPHHSLRLRGDGYETFPHAGFAFKLDLPSDLAIVDALAGHPLDRAITHTDSRALIRFDAGNLILETNPVFYRLFLGNPTPVERLIPTATLTLGYALAPIWQSLWFGFELEFRRFGASHPWSTENAVHPDFSRPIPGHSRVSLAYELSSPIRLGPIQTEASVNGRHQYWLPDGNTHPAHHRHLFSFGLIARLPLGRRIHALTHVVEPFVRYGITPLVFGRNPKWVTDRMDFLETGHGLEAGVRTFLKNERGVKIADIHIYERFALPGFGDTTGPIYAAVTAEAGPDMLRIALLSSFDHGERLPSNFGISLVSRAKNGNFFKIGGQWIGSGRGPHQDVTLGHPLMPSILPPFPDLQSNLLEVNEEASIALTRRLRVFEGGRMGVFPHQALHTIWYGFEISSSCGCIRFGVTASHRLGQKIPDAMATLNSSGF